MHMEEPACLLHFLFRHCARQHDESVAIEILFLGECDAHALHRIFISELWVIKNNLSLFRPRIRNSVARTEKKRITTNEHECTRIQIY